MTVLKTLQPLPAWRRRASSVLLLGATLLSACSGGNTGTTDTQPDDALMAKYPYLPGVDYTWTYDPKTPDATMPWVGPKIRAQGGPTETYLSAMTYSQATNGYGPVETNRSNGESTPGDGNTLTIGGQAYAFGLGAHANSDIKYSLGGNCTVLSAQVGVDDEVANNGSVVFQIWDGPTGSGHKLYDSGKLTGADTAKPVSVNLTDVNELHLVVTDAGDGVTFDHADWAAPKITCSAPAPSGDKFLSDLNPVESINGYGSYEKNMSNGEAQPGDGKPLTIRGVQYPKGLGTHAVSSLKYTLGGTCSVFTASVGIDDEVNGKGNVIFAVYGDGDQLYNSGPMSGTDAAKSVNVNVAGLTELKLAVSPATNSIDYAHADWANAKVTCSDVKPTITAVTPTSSASSRRAASATVSPSSTIPPGSENTWSSGGLARAATSTRPSRTTATEAARNGRSG